jgi:MFS family permease
VEGFGFLLATVPAPGLLRRLVEPARMNATLGLWGAYMPFGTAAALLCGPWVMAYLGWRGWWWLLAVPSAAMGLWLYVRLPRDHPRAGSGNAARADRDGAGRWRQRLLQTLSAPGPWLVATAFAMYSAQWLSVVGFLPTIYAQAGLPAGVAGVATALAALVNMVGNIAAGKLLQRGVRPHSLLYLGFAGMGVGAFVAFADIWSAPDSGAAFAIRYVAVLMFSMVGGLVPGTSFSLAVRLAPSERTVSTTVGWMQQWSSFGQFAAPPVVAWVASGVGGWQWSWLVLGAFSLTGAMVAAATGSLLRRKARLRDAVQDAT